MSRDLLMRSLWKGSTQSSRSRALDVCVARVRTRLALRKENGFSLLPVYGRGYKLMAADSADERIVHAAPHAGAHQNAVTFDTQVAAGPTKEQATG